MKLRRAFFVWTFVISGVLMCLLIAGLEWTHYRQYGHLVSYGLHVDSLNEDAYIGIPGQTKMYWARLSNYSFFPVSLPACDYVTDAFDPGTKFPHALQKWDAASNSWQTIVDFSSEGFCQPVGLSTLDTHAVVKKLWPGSSVEVMDGQATGAHDAFRKGDVARYVVFIKMNKTGEWESAIPSVPFKIEDDVIRANNDSGDEKP